MDKKITRRKTKKEKRSSKSFASLIVVIFFAVIAIIISLNNDNITEKGMAKNCTERYFEGEAKVRGWLVGDDEGNAVVQIAPSDLGRLPGIADKNQDPFIVSFVDAPGETRKKLESASNRKPAYLTIRGFASVCDSAMPLVSSEPATKAFKRI